MPDLKIDLINKVAIRKQYDELELIRLGGDDKMNYEKKVNEMAFLLKNISESNAQLALIEFYFQAPPTPVEQDAPTQAPHGRSATDLSAPAPPLPGQSHGE